MDELSISNKSTTKNTSSISPKKKVLNDSKIEESTGKMYKTSSPKNPFAVDDLIVESIKYTNNRNEFEDSQERIMYNYNDLIDDKIQTLYESKQRKSSQGLNGSEFSDHHQEILYEISKSIKELNQRLIKNEENTISRERENYLLRSNIKSLEDKIDQQKGLNLEKESVRVECTNSCVIF